MAAIAAAGVPRAPRVGVFFCYIAYLVSVNDTEYKVLTLVTFGVYTCPQEVVNSGKR